MGLVIYLFLWIKKLFHKKSKKSVVFVDNILLYSLQEIEKAVYNRFSEPNKKTAIFLEINIFNINFELFIDLCTDSESEIQSLTVHSMSSILFFDGRYYAQIKGSEDVKKYIDSYYSLIGNESELKEVIKIIKKQIEDEIFD